LAVMDSRWAEILHLVRVYQSAGHPARHCRAVLGGVKALRSASPPRVARAGPSGLDGACAPRGPGQYAVASGVWRSPVQENPFQVRSE